jgi:hypothetical protein
MKDRAYFALSGTIFGVVGLAHFARLATGTVVVIAGREVGFSVSWVGGFAAVGLAIWAFLLAGRAR